MLKVSGKMLGVVAFGVLFFCAPLCFGQALDQLQDAYNTGVTFDGSDGQRSGMDTGISSSGEVPEASAPEPVYVPQEEPVAQQEPEPTYSEPAPQETTYQEPEPTYQEPQPTYQEPEPVYQEPEPVKEGTYDADN